MANPKDPRKGDFDTVNKKLFDRTVRHLLYLTKLSTQEAKWLVEKFKGEMFDDVVSEVMTATERAKNLSASEGPILSKQQTEAIDRMSERIADKINSALKGVEKDFKKRMEELGMQEVEFNQKLLQKTVPVELSLDTPTSNQIRSILDNQPFAGRKMDEWFSSIGDSTRKNVTQEVRTGMVNGESIDDIVRRIRGTRSNNFTDGVLNTTTRHARTLARSSVIHTSNHAAQQLYSQNSDVVKGVQWVATLDTNTCETCADLDGEIYKPTEGERPPVHPGCRCFMAPVTRSWKEMGYDKSELDAGTRASMSGEVPGSMTYNEWLKKQPDSVVKEALGPTKAKLFKEGNLSISNFVSRKGDILTLKQIRKKESDIFEKLDLN